MITVKYSCPLCGIVKRPVEVPARNGPEEDMVEWMKVVGEYLSGDHALKSPDCQVGSLCDVMIPVGANYVGEEERK